MKDRNVVALLNSLDRLIHEARARKDNAETNASNGTLEEPIAPHTLPPSDLVNAHLAPFLTDMRSTITTETSALESNNENLIQTIKAQRAEMEALVSGLEHVVADLEKSANMMQMDEVQGLSKDVKMVEEELKT
jgi:kinetochore protein NNF1